MSLRLLSACIIIFFQIIRDICARKDFGGVNCYIILEYRSERPALFFRLSSSCTMALYCILLLIIRCKQIGLVITWFFSDAIYTQQAFNVFFGRTQHIQVLLSRPYSCTFRWHTEQWRSVSEFCYQSVDFICYFTILFFVDLLSGWFTSRRLFVLTAMIIPEYFRQIQRTQ